MSIICLDNATPAVSVATVIIIGDFRCGNEIEIRELS